MNNAELERERERRKTRKSLARMSAQAEIDLIAMKQMFVAQQMEVEAEANARWLADLECRTEGLTGKELRNARLEWLSDFYLVGTRPNVRKALAVMRKMAKINGWYATPQRRR